MSLPLLAYIDLASNVVPLGAAIMYRGKWAAPVHEYQSSQVRRSLTFLFCFVLLGALSESSTFILGRLGIRNLWVVHIYTLLEYVLLVCTLVPWQRNRAWRSIQLGSIPAFALFWLVSKLAGWEVWSSPDTYTHTFESILILLWALLLLGALLRTDDVEELLPHFPRTSNRKPISYHRDVRFWLATGVLLYFGGNIMFAVVIDQYVMLTRDAAIIVAQVHWILNVLVNCAYAAAFAAGGWEIDRILKGELASPSSALTNSPILDVGRDSVRVSTQDTVGSANQHKSER
jgi:hypothetical protein